jgi:DNA-binding NtrC family response regulator
MVVDDDIMICELLEKFFERSGFKVMLSYGGNEAIGIFQQGVVPDLVILDMKMPSGTGLDVLHEIHRIGAAVPVIMLTGTIDAEKYSDIFERLKFPKENICYKPIELSILLDMVKKRLSSSPEGSNG